MIEKKRIGIVILNYQSYKDTIKLLKNLYEISQISENLELFTCVVDNASPNDSVEIIENELNTVYSKEPFFLFPLETNSGYSTGNNAGVKFLSEKDCQYIFIMNNDIEITNNNFFQDMLTSINNSKAAIVGPGVIQKGKMELPLKRERPTFFGIISENFLLPIKILINRNKRNKLKRNKEIQSVYSVSGCCFLIDAQQALEDGKLFDDRLFLYEEETILGERMFSNNLLVTFDPTTSVIHAHGATITKHYDKKKQDKIKDQSFRIYLDDYRLDFNDIQKTIIMFSRKVRWKYEQIIASLK
ncbi:glycosyltransferase family 2 protein [Enterococcus hulanensis]|uniref:glycosyltransferase n=1 Tax=Enterococcus hulanensis TaxID=2559929 RepID=UPI001A8EEA8F|nr:glycosyltransferase family 2 protein [Enterococcus hulanensis]MBO0459361.1 glycosyltransferase family 2 protein [Enterococcus hulanensis]